MLCGHAVTCSSPPQKGFHHHVCQHHHAQVSWLHEQRPHRADRLAHPHPAPALPHDGLHAAHYGPVGKAARSLKQPAGGLFPFPEGSRSCHARLLPSLSPGAVVGAVNARSYAACSHLASPDSPSVTPLAAVRVLGCLLHASGRRWQLWESRQCLIWQKAALETIRASSACQACRRSEPPAQATAGRCHAEAERGLQVSAPTPKGWLPLSCIKCCLSPSAGPQPVPPWLQGRPGLFCFETLTCVGRVSVLLGANSCCSPLVVCISSGCYSEEQI